MKKLLLSIVAVITISFSSFSQLSGTYTIGGTGASYASVKEAVDTLNANGVNGAVTFNIRSGTYVGTAKINNFTGASAANLVRFRPDPTNTGQVIIEDSSLSQLDAGVVIFNSCKYVEFDSLTIRTKPLLTTPQYGHAVEFKGVTNHITIKGCVLTGYNTVSTNANSMAVVFDNTGVGSNSITLEGNTISGGSHGIYAFGTNTSSRQSNWKIKDNIIRNWYYSGAFIYYTDSVSMEGNIINNGTARYSTPRGIYMYYCYNSDVIGNQLQVNANSYAFGLNMIQCGSLVSSARRKIANNMVYTNVSFNRYACYIQNANYVDIVFNTVKVDRKYFNNLTYATYILGGAGTTVRNNNIVNMSRDPALYISGSQTRSHNNIYTTGSNAIQGGTLSPTSISVDPLFVGTTDLHIKNVALFGSGLSVTGITTDIDGDTRASSPCIGADEFLPDTLDLAAKSLKQNYCAGNQTVEFTVQNFGLDTIRNGQISWSVAKNGGARVSQPPHSFTTSLSSGKSTVLNLGSYVFSTDTIYQIWAKIDSVNGQIEKNRANDSLKTDTFRTSLNGTYYVGGINPDFPTLNAAINTLNRTGICGPTTLKLRSGTYHGRVTLGAIPGVSSTDTIRITSDTGATQAIITDTSSSPTLWFSDASYITFDRLTIKNESNNGTVASFFNANNNITFDSCYMKTDTVGNSFNCRIISNERNNPLRRLSIKRSVLEGGYASIYCYGDNTSSRDSSLSISDCDLRGFNVYGLYIWYQAELSVTNSKIDNWERRGFPANTAYGAYMYYCDQLNFSNNSVRVNATFTPYGVYAVQANGTAPSHSKMINNMITLPRTTYPASSRGGAMYYTGNYCDIYFNNVLAGSGGGSIYSAYVSSSVGSLLRNNNFVHLGSGVALTQFGSPFETHNNLYAPNGTSKNVGQGAFGLNDDPGFYSNHDLHTRSISIDGKGTPIAGITEDIDGDTRSTTAPDFGADEFTPPAVDIRPSLLYSPIINDCGQDSTDVLVIIQNNGSTSQTAVPVKVIVSGIASDTLNVVSSRSLTSTSRDTINMGKINTRVGGRLDFQIVTSLTGDLVKANDTLYVENIQIDRSPNAPSVGSNIIVCDNIDSVLVNTTPSNTAYWYDGPNGKLLHEGDSLTVNINATDTVWVKTSDDYTSGLGMFNNTGSGTYTTATGNGLQFDVYRELTLDSITVYPQDSGTVRIRLLSSSNTLLRDTSFSVGGSGETRLPVGFRIDPGKGYKLDALGSNTRGLWYNYSSFYPFRDSDSSIFITGDNNGGNRSYFFFYNWLVKVEGCESELLPVTIGRRPSINVALGNDTAYCTGSTFNLTLNASNSNAVGYRWQNGSLSPSQTLTTKGTYHVAVTSNNGCVSRDTLEVAEVPQPTVKLNDTNVCINQGSFLFKGSPAGGVLSGTGIATNGRFYAAVAGAGAHNITYSYSDPIGCAGSDVAVIRVNTQTTAGLTSPGTVCQNRKKTFALSGGTPAGPSGYYIGNKVQSNNYLPDVVGKDTVGYVYLNFNSCSDTAYAEVDVIPSPFVVFDPVVGAVCDNTPNITLSATPAGGVFSGTAVTGNVFDPTTAGKGKHNLKYEATGSNNCVTEEIQEIEIFEAPVVVLADFSNPCENDGLLNLSGGTPAGGRYYGPFTNPNTGVFDIFGSGAGTFPIKYEVVNFDQCRDSATKNLTVYAYPKPSLGGDKFICGNNTVTLDAGPGLNYVWSSGEKTQTVVVSQAGTYAVTVSNGTCTGDDVVNVNHEGICVGIAEELGENAQVNYYPNPSSGVFNISLAGITAEDIQFEVTTLNGKLVHAESFDEVSSKLTVKKVDLSALSEGIYMARIRTEKGDVVHRINIIK